MAGPVLRFAGWWAGLFALPAGGSVCPCCGTTTCPGGVAGVGLLGGLLTILLYVPRWMVRLLRKRKKVVPANVAMATVSHEEKSADHRHGACGVIGIGQRS